MKREKKYTQTMVTKPVADDDRFILFYLFRFFFLAQRGYGRTRAYGTVLANATPSCPHVVQCGLLTRSPRVSLCAGRSIIQDLAFGSSNTAT